MKLPPFGLSLRYQLEQYFENSSLHGVRFIREAGRPASERFLWFCLTSSAAVITLIIIMSLWDKFQTNPTITGLDTDSHDWDVPFPAVSVCVMDVVNLSAVQEHVRIIGEMTKVYSEYIAQLVNISYETFPLMLVTIKDKNPPLDPKYPVPQLQDMFAYKCEELVKDCVFKGQPIDCCGVLRVQATENGLCLAFNTPNVDEPPHPSEAIHHIYETDEELSFEFSLKAYNGGRVKVFLYSSDELPTIDYRPQVVWDLGITDLFFAEKHTYTTPSTQQLSVRQRRCIFPDEMTMLSANARRHTQRYTYPGCMLSCRMDIAMRVCGCVPPFYRQTDIYPHCGYGKMPCLFRHVKLLTDPAACKCLLGCMNTRYEVERIRSEGLRGHLVLSFVSWPFVRYKRDVLFGWVDLLVSFGGIAGLFLGFSLLSGVEVVYYLSLRAACMALQGREDLLYWQCQQQGRPRPALDLSLLPACAEAHCAEMVRDHVDPGLQTSMDGAQAKAPVSVQPKARPTFLN